MAEIAWTPRLPFTPLLGNHASSSGTAGFAMEEQRDFDLFQVLVRRGRWNEAARACGTLWGAAPPDKPGAVSAPRATILWCGPGQFLALIPGPSAFVDAGQAFAGAASVSDQGSGRVFWRLSGPRLREVLAKVCSIDLDARVFPVGGGASTVIDHTNVVLWRAGDGRDGEPVFGLLAFSSFAASLAGNLTDAALEDA